MPSGNQAAWKEMERYNKYDVLSLEELYEKLAPWDSSINFNIYNEDTHNKCSCGSTKFRRKGYAYTEVGKFQRYECLGCGKNSRDRKNLLNKEKKSSLRVGTR